MSKTNFADLVTMKFLMLVSALLEAARKANFKGTFSQIAEGFATERYINFMLCYYYFGTDKLFLIVGTKHLVGNSTQE